MKKRSPTRLTPRVSLDRNIDRLRQQLARLTPFLSKGKAHAASILEGFDLETERMISEVFGETSEMLEAYEHAQLGEAALLLRSGDDRDDCRVGAVCVWRRARKTTGLVTVDCADRLNAGGHARA